MNVIIGKAILGYASTIGVDGTGKLNRRNMMVLIIYTLYFLSSCAFLVYRAKTFRDNAMCAYVWVTLLSMIVGFSVMITKANTMFHVRDRFSESIKKGM